MKHYRFLSVSAVIVLFICLFGHSASDSTPRLNIIPQPRQVSHGKSQPCVLNDDWTVFVESTADETTRLAAELIAKDLSKIWGLKTAFSIDDKALVSAEKSIIIGVPQRDRKVDAIATNKAIALHPDLHPQGYKVSITPDWKGPGKILLLANSSQGLFYAAQTFRQLISKDAGNQVVLPAAVIDDWPLFDCRGVQINVPDNAKIDYLKNFIHLLAYYKMNILALQSASLTDERIEELTKEASAYQIKLVNNISMITPNSSHHICKDKARCGHLGRRPLGWADAVLKEQRFYSKMPKTTIVANTFEQDNTYNISNYYEQIESFRKEGLEQILCPRLSFQGDLLPDIKAVHMNIYNASQAGLRHLDNSHNIMGLMLCQNPEDRSSFFEACLEPIAFTAVCAWLPDRTDAHKFSANLTHSLFGINSNEAQEIINLLSSCNELIRNNIVSGNLFADPFKSGIHLNTPHFYGSLRKIKSLSDEAQKKIASLQEKSLRSREVLDVWRYSALLYQTFAERFLTAREISGTYRHTFYGWKHSMRDSDRQSIEKQCVESFDKASKEMHSLQEEYIKLISQRYAITETATAKSFEATKTAWQDKKKAVSVAILSEGFPTPDEVGVSLAKLPERLVEPKIKPPTAEIEKAFTWWDRRVHHRVLITVENAVARPAIGKEEFAYPVEIELNFAELLQESTVAPYSLVELEFDPQSIRVIEYSKEGTPITEVPYQIDKSIYFSDTKFNPKFILNWIIRKPIEAKTTKYFYVYFDTAKNQAPKYSVKYPHGGLSVSATDDKGYRLKNDRFKIKLPQKYRSGCRLYVPSLGYSYFINSWIVRNFSTGLFTNLDLVDGKKRGFAALQGAINSGFGELGQVASLESEISGPLITRLRADTIGDDEYLFNFYENLPICEVFIESRINEFHNSYLIPQSYLATALKDKMSALPGAEYLSSGYNLGKIPTEQSMDISFNDSYWLAQRIVKGLTIAAITPEKPVTHYLKTTLEDSNTTISFGVSGNKPLHHFILYADTTEQDTFDLLNRIKNVFTLDNLPVIQRNRAEKLLQ
ncbi:MAG: glycoside hydrolase family 20 zincin-like fold domain-containing protein [Planctomycetota bacterium]